MNRAFADNHRSKDRVPRLARNDGQKGRRCATRPPELPQLSLLGSYLGPSPTSYGGRATEPSMVTNVAMRCRDVRLPPS